MSLRSRLIDKINGLLIPLIKDDGFVCSPLTEVEKCSLELNRAFPFGYLKRHGEQTIDQIEIQLDKGGRPYFVLNMAKVPIEGIMLNGEHFPSGEVTVFDVPGACRLYSGVTLPRLSGPQWFGQSLLPIDKHKRIDRSVKMAVDLYPEVMDFFVTGALGKHIRCL